MYQSQDPSNVRPALPLAICLLGLASACRSPQVTQSVDSPELYASARSTAQAPTGGEHAGSEELPAIAARIQGQEFSMGEFRDFVVELAGRQWMPEFVRQQLFELEAEQLGLLPTEAELKRANSEALATYIGQRYQGDQEKYLADLERQGQSPASFEKTIERYTRVNLLQQALVLQKRVITDEMVNVRFGLDYGPGGLRTDVRHIVLTRASLGIELARAGLPLEERSNEKIEARLVERALQIVAELDAGAEFGAQAAKYSHDNQASRTGGVIENYDFLRYGPALAEAIAAAPIGEVSAPVVTPTAVHVFEVTARTQTQLADVEKELRATLAAEPANPAEVQELERALRERSEIWTYLML